MPLLIRVGLVLALACLSLTPAFSQENKEFRSEDGSYSFQYPPGFWVSTLFPDGTGEATGVMASTVGNGDVNIHFHAIPARAVKEVNATTVQAYVDQYVKDLADRKTKFAGYTTTTMLGRRAVDMRFDERGITTNSVRRLIATIVDGQDYFLVCAYRADKARQFDPACELAASTLRLRDAADEADAQVKAGVDEAAPEAGDDGACSLKAFRARELAVVDKASEIMMRDQSAETIARLRKAHEAAAQVGDRVTASGGPPTEQDCKDIDAIMATLN